MEFDPFSGSGLDTLELVWEPCISKFGMAPPLVVCCVSQNDTVSVSVMRLNDLGDREVESPTRHPATNWLTTHKQRPDDCAERSISFDNCLSHKVIPINNHDGQRQLK